MDWFFSGPNSKTSCENLIWGFCSLVKKMQCFDKTGVDKVWLCLFVLTICVQVLKGGTRTGYNPLLLLDVIFHHQEFLMIFFAYIWINSYSISFQEFKNAINIILWRYGHFLVPNQDKLKGKDQIWEIGTRQIYNFLKSWKDYN